MALSDYQQIKQTVKGKGGSFEVRGLNADDLTYLVSLHLADVEAAFKLYETEVGKAFSVTSFQSFLMSAINALPGLVSEVISIAADEPEMRDKAAKLPLAVQTDALFHIAALTVEDAGGLKNVWATVRDRVVKAVAAKSLTQTNQNGQARSNNTSTESERT